MCLNGKQISQFDCYSWRWRFSISITSTTHTLDGWPWLLQSVGNDEHPDLGNLKDILGTTEKQEISEFYLVNKAEADGT